MFLVFSFTFWIMLKQKPTYEEELTLLRRGYRYIAGVDEVGRGAFAGPVVAAAVILPYNFKFMTELDDSKKLSEKKREQLATIIKLYALSYAIAEVSLIEINRYGIGIAAKKAFSQALGKLDRVPDYVLIDAFRLDKSHRVRQKAIIHGDSISVSIAAASIIAKVYRDRLMESWDADYPEYGFAAHKGYGTADHRQKITEFGLCPLHRTSFKILASR